MQDHVRVLLHGIMVSAQFTALEGVLFVMAKKHKIKSSEIQVLPISIGEARKLLGNASKMSDDDVAQEIVLLNEIGRIIIKTLGLQ